jgi:hypothetical protein
MDKFAGLFWTIILGVSFVSTLFGIFAIRDKFEDRKKKRFRKEYIQQCIKEFVTMFPTPLEEICSIKLKEIDRTDPLSGLVNFFSLCKHTHDAQIQVQVWKDSRVLWAHTLHADFADELEEVLEKAKNEFFNIIANSRFKPENRTPVQLDVAPRYIEVTRKNIEHILVLRRTGNNPDLVENTEKTARVLLRSYLSELLTQIQIFKTKLSTM